MLVDGRSTRGSRLHLPQGNLIYGLLLRLAVVNGLLLVSIVGLWWQRDGLQDGHDGVISLLDVVYFAIVTVSTVGFGDIVPVTPEARLFVAIAVTPIRAIVWLIFLGTAYQLFLRQQTEAWQIRRLQRTMKDHTIVCGYGVKGRVCAEELLDCGLTRDDIVVIDTDEESVEAAVADGYRAFRGDTTSTRILKDAGIDRAKTLICAVDVDAASVLLCLTVRDINPKVRIIAAARETENIRLLERSGADLVIAPSVAGGKLLATAVEDPASVRFIEDFFDHARGMHVQDRKVAPEEVGKRVDQIDELEGTLVVGLRTATGSLDFERLRHRTLQDGDVLVTIVRG